MAAGTSLTVTVVLGLVAVVIPQYSRWLTTPGPSLTARILVAVFVLALVWFVSAVIALFSLYRMPPAQFASIVVAGQRPSRVFSVITFEIWRLCSRFLESHSTQVLHQALAGAAPLEHEALLRDHIEALEDFIAGQQNAIQRVREMKRLAALQLAIPPRRLCDRVFQFSPDMFLDRITKFVSNAAEMLDIQSRAVEFRGSLQNRLEGLGEQNNNIHKAISNRLNYQAELFTFKYLHGFIHKLASERSASSAVKEYAAFLSYIAERALARLPGGRRGQRKPEKQGHDGFREGTRARRLCSDQLRFAFYKQRAYPGFDLHYACFNLCNGESERSINQELLRSQAGVLNAIQVKLRTTDADENRSFDPFSVQPDIALGDLKALKRLNETVSSVIEQSRDEIVDKFEKWYRAWVTSEDDGKSREWFIVTHDYSKTVRELLKRLFGANDDGAPRVQGLARPSVFLMKPCDEDALDSRLMAYELQERLRSVTNVYVGDENLITHFGKKRARVVVVLGAECFDVKLRAVRPRGASERLDLMKARLGENRMRVVVVGEGYKGHESLLEIPQLFRANLDRVSIYPTGLVNRIISDDSPSGCRFDEAQL